MEPLDEVSRLVLSTLDVEVARSADDVLEVVLTRQRPKRVMYSTASMTRVLGELEDAGLVEEAVDAAPFGSSKALRRWVITEAGRAALAP